MKWLAEMSSGSAGHDITELGSSTSPSSSLSQNDSAVKHRSCEVKSPTSNLSSHHDRTSKRRHSESKSPTSGLLPTQTSRRLQHHSTSSFLCEASSPSKRCKFIKEGIDERIERSRKGIHIAIHPIDTCIYCMCPHMYCSCISSLPSMLLCGKLRVHVFGKLQILFVSLTSLRADVCIYTGLMELPLSQLSQPPRESRLLREADPTFIRHLKLKMMQDPSAPGATPMAVLCKDIEEVTEFNVKHKNVYKYAVLGGLHTHIAKNQLMDEYPDNPFYKVVTADIYVGLSDKEALRLAQRHKQNFHFIHRVTHRDLVCGMYACVCVCQGNFITY